MNSLPRCCFLLAATAFSLPRAVGAQEAASVVVSAQVVGRTPSRIGYVLGDDLPGSNVSSWLRYSEINCARFWWPYAVWPAPPARWEEGSGLARFESERAILRRDGASQIDWKSYRAAVSKTFGGTPAGTIGDAFVLSELKKMGAAPLLMLSHSRAAMPFDAAGGEPDWFGRWTFWRGVYVNALYLSRTYGIERFQLFNEPDHSDSEGFEQADFLRRLQLGSDAVQAAIADANRLDGTRLTPRVSAPVTAGMAVYGARQNRSDTRDAATGWGELVVRARSSDFPGRSRDNRGLFQNYAFQNYGRNPASISSRLPGLIERIAHDNGGQALPMIASEMNVSTAFDFAKTPSTLDTPSYYAAFGAIAAAYTNGGLDEAYVFRLTQSVAPGATTKKNGVYFIDSHDPLKNIASSTKTAEAARLWMRGFSHACARFAAPTAPADLHAVAARDLAANSYTLLLANLGAERALSLDLAAWKLPGGALATVEEVSSAHHGDVSQVLALPASGRFPLAMSANSVALVTVRPTLSGTPRRVQVLADTRPGTLRAEALKTSGRVLLVFSASATQVGTSSLLRVRVYGAGDLAQADLLGQVTLGAKPAQVLVDATRYVQAAAGKPLVFRVAPDDARLDAKAITIGAAQLQVFDMTIAKNAG